MPGPALQDWLEASIGASRTAGSPMGAPADMRPGVTTPDGTGTTRDDPGRADEAHEVARRLSALGDELAASDELRGRLVGAGTDLPLSLGNTAVQNLNACEGLAVAEAGEDHLTTWEMFRGRALDAYVAHGLSTGPVGDAVGDLHSMWSAQERSEDLMLLDGFAVDPSHVADLDGLGASAAAFANCDRWIPRAEVTMGCTLGQALTLRGRVDVVFGGPGTGLPAVLVEVKSGSLRDSHFAQLRHYVMLAALRHDEMPAAAALWSPGTGLVPIHVAGSAHSAAERVAVAVGNLVELWLGREEALTPGIHCRFCPDEGSCARAHDYESPWADDL